MKRRAQSGQAIVELTVALVVIMVLVAALLEIGTLTRLHLDTMNGARERAGMYAVSDDGGSDGPGPAYLATWAAGPDGATYSRDDVPISGNAGGMRRFILKPSKPNLLSYYVPSNAVSQAYNDTPLVDQLGLVHGHDESHPVVLLPVVRHLLYNRDTVKLEADAWMVWTEGIY